MSAESVTPWDDFGVSEDERRAWKFLFQRAYAQDGRSMRRLERETPMARGTLSGVLTGDVTPHAPTVKGLRLAFNLPAKYEDADIEVTRRERETVFSGMDNGVLHAQVRSGAMCAGAREVAALAAIVLDTTADTQLRSEVMERLAAADEPIELAYVFGWLQGLVRASRGPLDEHVE